MLALLAVIGSFELQDPSVAVDLSGLWLFRAGDSMAFSQPNMDDDDWDQRRVPGEEVPWSQRFTGHGWYRMHLRATQLAADADLLLALGPAREMVEVYVNGGLVAQRGRFGSRPNGGARVVPLAAPIPSGLLHAGDNVIAVRVYDPSYLGGLVAGPIMIGPPSQIAPRVSATAFRNLSVRLGFAALALVIALGHALIVARGRQSREELWWTAAAGIALACWHLAGIGIFETFLPNLELALRLPVGMGFISVLSVAQLLALRFGDAESTPVVAARGVLAVLIAAALLLPDAIIFYSERPARLIVALLATLYVAHLAAQASRRQERGALILFVAVMLQAVVIVYDALTATRKETLPPLSASAAVIVLLISTLVSARNNTAEYEETLERMSRLRKRLDDRDVPGVLDTVEATRARPSAWLDVAVREAALRMAVRRCSLVLGQPDGTLILRAAVGLPTHVQNSPVNSESSIAGYVYRTGTALSRHNLPEDITATRRAGAYLTDAFLSFPVRNQERVLGVLNVSDKDDSSDFSADDEARLAAAAAAIADLIAS
jgi:GAF domain-containing protein